MARNIPPTRHREGETAMAEGTGQSAATGNGPGGGGHTAAIPSGSGALDDFGGLLDWPKLTEWIASHDVPGSGPVTSAKKLTGGLQNSVFLIERGSTSFVLRRPSKHVRQGSNETMLREA